MKTILYHSNNSRALTGFGKHCKNVLKYLQKTGKYKLIEFANGAHWSAPIHTNKPWKCVGSIPDGQNTPSDQQQARALHYGSAGIDKAIREFKPDIYIGVEDIWAFNGYWDKPWWNNINHIIWTTLDSQPILPQALEAAPKTKNFFVWSSFAERDMVKEGHDHIKTLHGTVNTEDFYRLSDIERFKLKNKFNLIDSYIVGFVFRNQLRKSVPNLLDGFKMFQKDCPKAKLLLHTHWSEGWDIPRLIQEKGIDYKDVLTTYFCKACKRYEIKPFSGQEQNCNHCGAEKTLNTTNVSEGVDEEQLNEIYNIMDVYCHPFTSGGMEIPIFEAKLTELPTLVTNYSCGEDSCTAESGGFPLEWAEYREPGTQFIKASTYPASIAKQLKKVWKLKPKKLKEIGEKARNFTLDNYSIEAVGKKLEEILDNLPEVDYSFMEKENISDENSILLSNDTSESAWKIRIDYFKKFTRPGKKLCIIMPDSAGDVLWINSLIENTKKLYPEYDIYISTKPNLFSYIEDHPDVFKCIPIINLPSQDQTIRLEGIGDKDGAFDIVFSPFITTKAFISYTHNGIDRTVYNHYENLNQSIK